MRDEGFNLRKQKREGDKEDRKGREDIETVKERREV